MLKKRRINKVKQIQVQQKMNTMMVFGETGTTHQNVNYVNQTKNKNKKAQVFRKI